MTSPSPLTISERGSAPALCYHVGPHGVELSCRSPLRLHIHAKSLAFYHVHWRVPRCSWIWFGFGCFTYVFFFFIPLLYLSCKKLGNPFRETGPPANMAKLILLRHKVCHLITFFFQSQITSSIQLRFKPQIESGAVSPNRDRRHEVTPSPHVRTQKPLGCALENPLGESNIIELLGHPLYIIIPKHISK